MSPYLKVVFPSAEDEGFIAEVPELEYCSAFGKTAEEALKELDKAIVLWLEAARDSGMHIPEPYRSRLSTSTSDTTINIQKKEPDYSDRSPQPFIEQVLVRH